VLKVIRALLPPRCRFVAADAVHFERAPDDVAHGCGFGATECGADTDPAVSVELLHAFVTDS
jgi:hypothetical protein